MFSDKGLACLRLQILFMLEMMLLPLLPGNPGIHMAEAAEVEVVVAAAEVEAQAEAEAAVVQMSTLSILAACPLPTLR